MRKFGDEFDELPEETGSAHSGGTPPGAPPTAPSTPGGGGNGNRLVMVLAALAATLMAITLLTYWSGMSFAMFGTIVIISIAVAVVIATVLLIKTGMVRLALSAVPFAADWYRNRRNKPAAGADANPAGVRKTAGKWAWSVAKFPIIMGTLAAILMILSATYIYRASTIMETPTSSTTPASAEKAPAQEVVTSQPAKPATEAKTDTEKSAPAPKANSADWKRILRLAVLMAAAVLVAFATKRHGDILRIALVALETLIVARFASELTGNGSYFGYAWRSIYLVVVIGAIIYAAPRLWKLLSAKTKGGSEDPNRPRPAKPASNPADPQGASTTSSTDKGTARDISNDPKPQPEQKPVLLWLAVLSAIPIALLLISVGLPKEWGLGPSALTGSVMGFLSTLLFILALFVAGFAIYSVRQYRRKRREAEERKRFRKLVDVWTSKARIRGAHRSVHHPLRPIHRPVPGLWLVLGEASRALPAHLPRRSRNSVLPRL